MRKGGWVGMEGEGVKKYRHGNGNKGAEDSSVLVWWGGSLKLSEWNTYMDWRERIEERGRGKGKGKLGRFDLMSDG